MNDRDRPLSVLDGEVGLSFETRSSFSRGSKSDVGFHHWNLFPSLAWGTWSEGGEEGEWGGKGGEVRNEENEERDRNDSRRESPWLNSGHIA